MVKINSDLEAAELISRSLSGDLSSHEQAELNEFLENQKQSQALATLSGLIEQSVLASSADDLESDEGLSDVAKERLKRAIRAARAADSASPANTTLSSQDDSSDGPSALPADYISTSAPLRKVAENETTYFSNPASSRQEVTATDEQRETQARFTLLKKIGEGGLGTVWLARDEVLGRNVALKEMNAKAAMSPKLWQRFEREAKITGHLEHPNVVPLYLSGVNASSGLPFYAMRFLGKQTLSEAIREYHAKVQSKVHKPLDLHRLLDVFLKVCQAIAFAHSRGVIHRDLKPDNVVLDNFGQVVVLDWGLAKLSGDGELAVRLSLSGRIEDANLSSTLDGDVVGTPLYMAPEQAAGDLDKVDTRTDVYGLGAILFAILTGNAPHENSHKSADGTLRVQEFLRCIATKAAPSPRSVLPDVPRDLDAICVRAMAAERFARHSSAMDLATDVERWMAGHHEKEARYDAMRLSGRDLKSRLCVQIRQLAAAAQFMSELPPIQGLLESLKNPDVEFATWRERLTTILVALAKSKPNVSGFSYCQIMDDRVEEITRVERSLLDLGNIRSLPQSRLRRGVANTFHRITMEQFPGEAHMDFDCTTAGTVRIVCGIPVFDAKSEEPFGLVAAEAEVGNLVLPELRVTEAPGHVYLIDDSGNILFTNTPDPNAKTKTAVELFPDWEQMSATLDETTEYLDSGRETYATRLAFPQKNHSIQIVFHGE